MVGFLKHSSQHLLKQTPPRWINPVVESTKNIMQPMMCPFVIIFQMLVWNMCVIFLLLLLTERRHVLMRSVTLYWSIWNRILRKSLRLWPTRRKTYFTSRTLFSFLLLSSPNCVHDQRLNLKQWNVCQLH